MSERLIELPVLVLDCQASGATPALGDLLEIGWGVTTTHADVVPAHAEWIIPASERRVSAVVRKLTGWSEARLTESIDAAVVWDRLRSAAGTSAAPRPTVIHYARFELSFLRELHERLGGDAESFPLDTVCVHAIAERLFPDLPRRNLRALAGYLGSSAELSRRARGHVEATTAIWRALVPRLIERELHTWTDLKAWLATPAARAPRGKRVFPMPAAARRALPDRPGVYRFMRPNGDVLYVGKATSLKKRVASHFSTGSRTTERALEMLTQAHDIDATETATALEAALLETAEIKRLDPPYNVQLRAGDRDAWFCNTAWSDPLPRPDADHLIGPLPSRWSLAGLAALRALLEGAEPIPARCAAAVEASPREGPEPALFVPVWQELVATELRGPGSARVRLLRAGARMVPQESPEGAAPGWDPARIRRHLERALVDGVLLVRRARLLSLLTYADVTFREPGETTPRTLHLREARITSQATPSAPGTPLAPGRLHRLGAFDADRYDQLRVLATELRRVQLRGGEVTTRIGRHEFPSRLGGDAVLSPSTLERRDDEA